jgi:type IV secretion system protein TrbG
MKSTLIAICCLGVSLYPSPFTAKNLEENYFSEANPALTSQENMALNIAKQWEIGHDIPIKPLAGKNGAIQFVYGVQQPSIVCAVLQVCDIALQMGEHVQAIHLGDTSRWLVEPAITGNADQEIQHLILKPLEVGLETSLVVATDRRSYHLRLRSHRSEYMPQVRFIYPEDQLAKWEKQKQQAEQRVQQRANRTLPETGEYLDDLSFDYDIAGSANWKPIRVYNDGQKTIIQMPRQIAQRGAPTLLLLRKEGGLFNDEETALVNYRVQRNRYIVDSVFDKAILIAGVGSNQERITITRRGS